VTEDERHLVAKVERETGLDMKSVEYVEIAPLVNGTCHRCGKSIQFVFIAWCDDCLPLFPDKSRS
jgi:hypothetical protein